MAGKIVEFSTRGTRFSITHRQLVVERPEHPKATLPIEDLGVVIVDDVCATYTQSVFIELITSGVTLIIKRPQPSAPRHDAATRRSSYPNGASPSPAGSEPSDKKADLASDTRGTVLPLRTRKFMCNVWGRWSHPTAWFGS